MHIIFRLTWIYETFGANSVIFSMNKKSLVNLVQVNPIIELIVQKNWNLFKFENIRKISQ